VGRSSRGNWADGDGQRSLAARYSSTANSVEDYIFAIANICMTRPINPKCHSSRVGRAVNGECVGGPATLIGGNSTSLASVEGCHHVLLILCIPFNLGVLCAYFILRINSLLSTARLMLKYKHSPALVRPKCSAGGIRFSSIM
jgi:hypothetical protein